MPSSLNLMVGQRLIPRLCQQCKKVEDVSSEVADIIRRELAKMPHEMVVNIKAPFKSYRSPGCPACKNKGISGRVALFEVMEMTPELRNIISEDPDEPKILEESKRQQMITLRQDGIMKAINGLVSMEEVLRETTEM